MILELKTDDVDYVIRYFQAIHDELQDIAGATDCLTSTAASVFRKRCSRGARHSLDSRRVECPACVAMQLDVLDPMRWPGRCNLCPLHTVCWQPDNSPYNRTLRALAARDPRAAAEAIGDGLAMLNDIRDRLDRSGGSEHVEVTD